MYQQYCWPIGAKEPSSLRTGRDQGRRHTSISLADRRLARSMPPIRERGFRLDGRPRGHWGQCDCDSKQSLNERHQVGTPHGLCNICGPQHHNLPATPADIGSDAHGYYARASRDPEVESKPRDSQTACDNPRGRHWDIYLRPGEFVSAGSETEKQPGLTHVSFQCHAP